MTSATGTAVHLLSGLGLVAEVMRRAEFALIPGRIGAQWLGHAVGLGNPAATLNQLLRGFFYISDPLCINLVIVFTDCKVKRPLNTRAVHVGLHLSVVHRLCLLHAFCLHLIK